MLIILSYLTEGAEANGPKYVAFRELFTFSIIFKSNIPDFL